MDLSRRSLLGATAAGLVLAACARPAADGDLNAILDQLSTDFLRESPEYSTSLSVSEEQAGGRYIDRLGDYTRAGAERVLQIGTAAKARLEALNRDSLEARDAVTYDVVVTALSDSIASAQYKTGGGAQAPYTVTQLTGSYTFIPDFLASQHPVT
ncbi:MAG: DUF885 family protein, partial [Hyphomonadaceae bacterium]